MKNRIMVRHNKNIGSADRGRHHANVALDENRSDMFMPAN